MSPRRRTKLEKYRQEKAAAANVGTFQGLNVADDDYYVLIEVEDLKYQLEVSTVLTVLTLLHSEWPKLNEVLAILSAIGLSKHLRDNQNVLA